MLREHPLRQNVSIPPLQLPKQLYPSPARLAPKREDKKMRNKKDRKVCDWGLWYKLVAHASKLIKRSRKCLKITYPSDIYCVYLEKPNMTVINDIIITTSIILPSKSAYPPGPLLAPGT
ncbi:hypothetical protein STEG23_004102 [Scotinomys teguina]